MPVKKQAAAATGSATTAKQGSDARATSSAGPTTVKIPVAVSAKIEELNSSGFLEQDIRKPKVARLLSEVASQHSVDVALELLEAVLDDDGGLADPNTFVNVACQAQLDAAAQEAEDDELWEEGWEEEPQGAHDQEADWDAAAEPLTKRHKGGAAYEEKLAPVVVKRVQQLNKTLSAEKSVELKHCGSSLSQLSPDQALQLLEKLEKCVFKIESPTAWVIQNSAGTPEASSSNVVQTDSAKTARFRDRLDKNMARDQERRGVGGKGGKAGATTARSAESSKGWDELDELGKAVKRKVAETNRAGNFEKPLLFRPLWTYFERVEHKARMHLLDKLLNVHLADPISDPQRWLEVACFKRASNTADAAKDAQRSLKGKAKGKGKGEGEPKGKGGPKGKGEPKGKGAAKAKGPKGLQGSKGAGGAGHARATAQADTLDPDGKTVKRMKWMNDNITLAKPLDTDKLQAGLSHLGEDGAFDLLKQLVMEASKVTNPTKWLLRKAQHAGEQWAEAEEDDGDDDEFAYAAGDEA